ncbi:ATP-binding cassette domain-containing protein [Clostridium sp. DJ247]|nr:ATP-binding cassette domain-containing protein [Clostridium sp. DJ247]
MGFIGPNGSGKSTTIKLIMNLIKRNAGEIKIFGLDNINKEKDIKQRIGFVYDENYFYEELSLVEMKDIIAPFYKYWDNKTFDKYISDFNLSKKKKIKDLSKGMKMKYSLAIALSHGAELIIMDEPTSGLDPVFRSELLDILYSIIQDENKSIFFSTHITTDLEKVADYITFLNKGKVVFSSTKDDILETYSIVKGDKSLLDRDIRKEFVGIRENSFGFEALTSNTDKIKKLFRDNALIEKATLEDIMVYITTPSVIAYMFIIYASACDDKNKSYIILNSLPINRKDIVISKYISVLVFIFIGVVISFLITTILKLSGFGHLNELMTSGNILGCSTSILLLSSLYFPIYFKFGYLKSKYFNMILFMCAFFIPTFLAENLGKGNIPKFIAYLNTQPNWLVTMFILAVLFIILLISLLISTKIYVDKDL